MSTQTSTLRRGIALGAAVTLVASGAVLAAVPAQAVSPDIVIAEVYAGGGNTGATYTHDFIELYNTGATTIDISDWSVQYASSAGTSWQVTELSGQIPPGRSYLVQEAQGAGGTTPLPTPDAIGTIAMGATAGKVALVTSNTGLTGCGAKTDPQPCSTAPGVHDFVGYGTSANDYEGSGRTPAPGNTTSVTRNGVGLDTDDNAADFTAGAPGPQNCGEDCEEAPPVAEPLTIAEIQGVGHLSDDEGILAETTGVTTAKSTNGYWIQDPTGDGNTQTSEGIFVFTGSGGAKPEVGDAVTVTGIVDEFRAGSSSGPGLNITELTGSSFEVTASGVPLPAATLFGPEGVEAPAQNIDNDAVTRIDVEAEGTYEPAEDAIDFYEQYEGMLVQLNSPRAVGPTNGFGEVVVVPRGPTEGVRSIHGGVVYSSYENPNARRLTLDDVIIGAGFMPAFNTGDFIAGTVVGPLDYGFDNWRVYPTTVPVREAGDTVRTSADPQALREVAVGTFNVENLSPVDDPAKFAALAEIVVDRLQSPDVLALEEVQDNSGPVSDGTVAANITLDMFVAAITAAGGPSYEWTQIDPVDGADGGQPGGNIRVAFLYRTDRGLEFIHRPGGDATTPTEATTIEGDVAITLSPGRVNPQDGTAWEATRKPLAAEFRWRGEKLFVIANHFSSKGGDEPLFGRWQPPTRSSEAKRHLQATSVNEFVQELLDVDPEAKIAVVGDINDFEFSTTVNLLTDGGTDLADLMQFKRPRQRYTYVFQGNSQVLDHILVSPSLAPAQPEGRQVRVRRDYDIVHVNADFADQVSDHDPQVVRLGFGTGLP